MTGASRPNLTSGHAFIARHFAESVEVLERVAADEAFLESCVAIATACVDSLSSGGKLLLAGNGGSAGDAQHIAGEFVSRLIPLGRKEAG